MNYREGFKKLTKAVLEVAHKNGIKDQKAIETLIDRAVMANKLQLPYFCFFHWNKSYQVKVIGNSVLMDCYYDPSKFIKPNGGKERSWTE